jgi:uncharacterized protein (TIGR00251 family)
VGYTPGTGRAEPRASLRLRVSPGAKRSEIVGRHGEGWKVRVTAQAERGKANDALLELLADALSVPGSAIRIVAGEGSRDKVIAVEGMTIEHVHRLLAGRQRKGTE